MIKASFGSLSLILIDKKILKKTSQLSMQYKGLLSSLNFYETTNIEKKFDCYEDIHKIESLELEF